MGPILAMALWRNQVLEQCNIVRLAQLRAMGQDPKEWQAKMRSSYDQRQQCRGISLLCLKTQSDWSHRIGRCSHLHTTFWTKEGTPVPTPRPTGLGTTLRERDWEGGLVSVVKKYKYCNIPRPKLRLLGHQTSTHHQTASITTQHLFAIHHPTTFTMKFTAIVYTLMAAATTYAAAAPAPDGGLQARDTCGPNFGADQRRTNSPCQASNGDRHFCGCDRTGVVRRHVQAKRHQTSLILVSVNRSSAARANGLRSATAAALAAAVAAKVVLIARLRHGECIIDNRGCRSMLAVSARAPESTLLTLFFLLGRAL